MRFGIGIPNSREGVFYPVPFATADDVVRLTKLAEKVGFDSVWATDFMAPVPQMGLPDSEKPTWLEAMITLAYLAGATERILVATGVLLLPFRDPVVLAKQAATLDQFSKGRFLFGWGLGTYRDEFTAVRTKQRKAHRGKILDETMEALHRLLTSEGKVNFEGEFHEFHDIEIHPKPVQNPLPIYVSGHAPETYPRIAKYGAGMSIVPYYVKDSAWEAVEPLLPHLEKAGRDISEIDRQYSTNLYLANTHEEAVERARDTWMGKRFARRAPDAFIPKMLVGTPDEVVNKIKTLEEQGVTHCVLTNIMVDRFEEMMEQAQRFGEEVLPAFK